MWAFCRFLFSSPPEKNKFGPSCTASCMIRAYAYIGSGIRGTAYHVKGSTATGALGRSEESDRSGKPRIIATQIQPSYAYPGHLDTSFSRLWLASFFMTAPPRFLFLW